MLALQILVTSLVARNMKSVFSGLGLKELPAPTALVIQGSEGFLMGWFVLLPAALVAAGWLWWRPHPQRAWINGALIVAFFLGWMLGLLGLVMPMVELLTKLNER